MNIEVVKEDISKIGNAQWGDDNGNMLITCDLATANIEEILLRNILKCFGEEYKIVSSEDFITEDCLDENGEVDLVKIKEVVFETNLPFQTVLDLHK